MWKSILFHILISFIAIYLIHYLWNHFKNSWTTKKSKDLVNTHILKYKKIAEEAIQNYSKKDFENNETIIREKELGEYLTSIYGDCTNCDNTPDIIAPNQDNIQIELMPDNDHVGVQL